MVEATTQLNYALNSNVSGLTTIVTNNGTSTIQSTPVDQNDFNLIASNCNSNKCCFCSKVFTNVYNCRRHIRTHSGEKPFQCNVCGKRFSRQSTLNAHEKVHTGNQSFKCDTCGMAFDVYRQLTEHSAVHRVDKPFTCSICNKSYSRATVLSQHMKSHSIGNTTATNTVNQVVTTIQASKPIEVPISTPKTTVTVPIISQQPLYKCQQCEKMFMTPTDLKEHEAVHLTIQKEEKKVVTLKEIVVMVKPDEPQIIQLMPQIKCSLCQEQFNTEQERNEHAVIHSRNVSTEIERNPVQVNMNINVSSGPTTTVQPPTTMEQTPEIPNLSLQQDEMLINENQNGPKFMDLDNKCKDEEPQINTRNEQCDKQVDKFKCDVCDKRFSILSNYNFHLRIHKREKPFRCLVCGKSFRLAKSLEQHMVLHTETSSFNCIVCSRTFSRSGALKLHMRSHTTAEIQAPKRSYIDVLCHDADDDLFAEDEENNIMLDFRDVAPTYCDICGNKFVQSHGNLRTHKCSKYNTNDDDDFDDQEENLASMDIWNCD